MDHRHRGVQHLPAGVLGGEGLQLVQRPVTREADPIRASCAIAVMAKAPQDGLSKTRLCPPLDYAGAAALSAAFLRDTTESMVAAARLAPIVPYAAYAPLGAEDVLRPHLAPG